MADKGSRRQRDGRIVHSRPQRTQPVAQARKSLNFRFILSEIDKPFLILVLVLLVFGITMMFSASYATSIYEQGDGYYYLKRQALFGGVGVIAMLIISTLDYHFFQNTKVAYTSFFVTFGITLYTAFFGTSTADANRWLVIGPIQFQPSEMLKITFIIIFAYIMAVNFPKYKKMKYCIVPFAAILVLVCGVLALQRHISAVMLVVLIGVTMMFVSGIPRKAFWIFIGCGAAAALLLVLVIIISGSDKFSYITTRFQSWQDPLSDIRGDTAQTYQGLLAIGSGGLFGLGFGESRQKYLYLPESQNDFIFSVICEELGFVGALVVIFLFLMFIIRGFFIASRAKDRFGMLLAVGIVMQIGSQALLNIAVACNAFPNTGISLPFFSYGGTALMLQLAEVGILLNISRQSNIPR